LKNKKKNKKKEQTMRPAILRAAALSAAAILATTTLATAAGQYDPGASDTEIKIGNIMPYSGPASAYGVIGQTQAAYFKKINEEGGINGRQVNFITYDDSYNPPATVEKARRLVEGDKVLLIFNSLGTPTNVAIQRYLNQEKVPQLFVASGATRWNDPKHFPWTMGFQPNYQTEAGIYAKYILQNKPDAKIAVLYQNDDYGKDYLKGLVDGLGAKANQIVAKESYDVTEPTVDSHIVTLQASGADVFVSVATPKFAAQSIRKVHQLGWHPMFLLNNVSASIGSVLKPAGLDNAQGIISAAYLKDATDPEWKNAEDMKAWNEFMDKYMPNADKSDASYVYAWAVTRTLVHVLKQCGDDLTRANIMKQAADLKGFDPGLLLPGITVNTSATNFAPIQQLQLMRFEGNGWKRFGPVMSGGDHHGAPTEQASTR
jgi:branched-chain amino acid transport system substrate-binding protein